MYSKREFFNFVPFLLLAPSTAIASGGAEKAKPAESNFIVTSQITGTIMNGLKAVGIMQVDLGIYTTDQTLKARLPQLKPVLVSSWRAGLQEYINRYYTPGQVPDANILIGILQRVITPQIGTGKARVLIQAIIAR